jgi:hypothetical protein
MIPNERTHYHFRCHSSVLVATVMPLPDFCPARTQPQQRTTQWGDHGDANPVAAAPARRVVADRSLVTSQPATAKGTHWGNRAD